MWDAKDGEARAFLAAGYGDRCQVCSSVLPRHDGTPYFEGVYLLTFTAGAWLDRPGNVLCLCPTCSAKSRHGSVEAESFVPSIEAWSPDAEGGSVAVFPIRLCGEEVVLRFTARHLLDLQEVIRAGTPDGGSPSQLASKCHTPHT